MAAMAWTESGTSIDVEALRPGPGVPWVLHLERVNPQKNEARLYLLSWEPTLLGWSLVRTYGRIGYWQRSLPPLAFDSPDEAWPVITAIMRLRYGYRLAGQGCTSGDDWAISVWLLTNQVGL